MLVLAINDHVLKTAWPGFVTGKLSDVAGVVMMALLVTALTGRSAIGFWATAIGFATLKTVPVVGALAVPVLGGSTRTDPTDLIALVVLVLDRGAGPANLPPAAMCKLGVAVAAPDRCDQRRRLRHHCHELWRTKVSVGLAVVRRHRYATTSDGGMYESADGGANWARSTVAYGDERLQRAWPDSLTRAASVPIRASTIVRPRGPARRN